MTPSRIAEVLKVLAKNQWPAFIWGPPGSGKSSVVSQVAKDLKRPLKDIRASLLDPTDLRGIPSIDSGRAVWCPPSFLPTEDEKPGILFFDELNAAPPLVQASMYQLTLDRRVGEYTLPKGWIIVAAGNRAEDRSVTFKMPSALSNRFIHLDFEVDFEDWRQWAIGNDLHPLVVAFLATRPELLHQMDTHSQAFPTPRSWEMASDTLKTIGEPKDARDVLLGIVGEAAVVEFLGFCENAIAEEQILAIIADPENATLPEKLGDLYALVSYLPLRSKQKGASEAAEALLRRLTPEFSVILARDMVRRSPAFARSAGYRWFISEHQEAIA